MQLDTTYNSFVDGQRVAQDVASGDYYRQIAETCPRGADPFSTEKRNAIEAQKPVHVASHVPGFTGYWVKCDSDPTAPVAPKAPATA
jgi:hypothetical protein